MIEHKPVLLKEVIKFFENVSKKENPVICDFTIGLGGHAEALLKSYRNLKIIGFDRDETALNYAKERLKDYSYRIELQKLNFANFDTAIDFKIDGALLDLGIGSHQLLDESRGFSFNSEFKLDMRMDKTQSLSAWEVVNKYPKDRLKEIFIKYGEIKNPKKVVDAIIEHRKKKEIFSCKELAEIIASKLKKRGRIHPATRFFQAIRIEVNKELEELEIFLKKIFDYLNQKGVLVIISFHSLEDRLVKIAFKKRDDIKILTKKPITPDYEEIRKNPRSRSAKLRACEKL